MDALEKRLDLQWLEIQKIYCPFAENWIGNETRNP